MEVLNPLLDDCLWHYKNPDGSIKGVITTHVDDLAITCPPDLPGRAVQADDQSLRQDLFADGRHSPIVDVNTPRFPTGTRWINKRLSTP